MRILRSAEKLNGSLPKAGPAFARVLRSGTIAPRPPSTVSASWLPRAEHEFGSRPVEEILGVGQEPPYRQSRGKQTSQRASTHPAVSICEIVGGDSHHTPFEGFHLATACAPEKIFACRTKGQFIVGVALRIAFIAAVREE
jgi:hypothetical protein